MEYVAKKECYVGKVHCKKGDKVDIAEDIVKTYPKKYFDELFYKENLAITVQQSQE